MELARILAHVTGTVDQELLARNEYLAAENRILEAQLKGQLKLSDAERATLGEIGRRLGRKVLGEVANVAQPDTILAWYRKLVARKFDGSKARQGPGRPRIKREIELAAGAERVCCALPCRAESSREVQRLVVRSGHGNSSGRACAMSRETGWALALLPSRGCVSSRASLERCL